MDEREARTLLGFAGTVGRGLRGLDADRWRRRVEGRYRELAAAFDWLLGHSQAGDALELATTLAEFLRISGRVATGRGWLDRALAAAAPDDPRRAVALYEHGLLAFWQGADEDACSLLGQSLHLARRLGDHTTIALALCGLARVALREDLDWAEALCQEALAVVAVEVGASERAATLLGAAAAMVDRQGNDWPPDEAPHFRRSRAAAASALGPGRFRRAWSAGRELPPNEAVSFALAPVPVEAGVAS